MENPLTSETNPRGIGDNNPPPDVDPLIVEAQERIEAGNRWLTERADIDKWDAEISDKLNGYLGQVSTTHSVLDEQRKEEGRKFTAKQKEKYEAPLTMMASLKAQLTVLRRKYLQKEEDKLLELKRKADAEAAEAKRQADEAQARIQAELGKKGGKPLQAQREALAAIDRANELQERAENAPVKATISGSYSARATGLKDKWGAKIDDLSAAFKHYNGKRSIHRDTLSTAIKECIQRIADNEARAIKKEGAGHIPGITIVKERV
jgi:hypothetical protein